MDLEDHHDPFLLGSYGYNARLLVSLGDLDVHLYFWLVLFACLFFCVFRLTALELVDIFVEYHDSILIVVDLLCHYLRQRVYTPVSKEFM